MCDVLNENSAWVDAGLVFGVIIVGFVSVIFTQTVTGLIREMETEYKLMMTKV